jgi:hypothetical protein
VERSADEEGSGVGSGAAHEGDGQSEVEVIVERQPSPARRPWGVRVVTRGKKVQVTLF